MTKRSRLSLGELFGVEVVDCFDPLRVELGLRGGPVPEHVPGVKVAVYEAGSVVYRVYCDLGDRAVSTVVVVSAGPAKLRFSLDDLVRRAGLGTRQSVPSYARGSRGLHAALVGQSAWIRRLHPRLSGPSGADFMRQAGAVERL